MRSRRGVHSEATLMFTMLSLALISLAGCSRGPDAAFRRLERAAELLRDNKPAAAQRAVDDVLNARPRDLQVYMAAMQLFAAKRMHRQAAGVGELAIERLKSGDLRPAPSKEEHARLLYAVAQFHQEAGNLAPAEANYRLALELAPDAPELLNGLGYFYAEENLKLGEALRLTRRAVNLAPNAAHIIDSLGWAQYRLGDYDAAVGTLRRAVELDPDEPTLRYHLAAAYAAQEQRLAARIEAHKSALLGGDDPELAQLIKTLQT